MIYKHRFYLNNDSERIKDLEVATCRDQQTANLLADYFRKIYDNNSIGVEIVYKHRKETRIISKPKAI